MAERRIPMGFHFHLCQRFEGDFPIPFRRSLQQAERTVSSHHHGFKNSDGEVPIDHALLRQVADLGSMVTAQLIAGAIEDMEMPFDGSHQAQYRFAERR